jgi:hypothetical protein
VNTLAHFGIQGIATRALLRDADARWIFLACVIPDIPWIVLALASSASPGLDPYDARLYAIVQASLAACLLLSVTLALLSEKPLLILGIVAFNSLAHLLVDAVEIKWGNGVHLLAPFTWELTSFGFVWPESLLVDLLTLFGLLYFLREWRRTVRKPSTVSLRPRPRLYLALPFLAGYLLAPLALLDRPEEHDNHSIHDTLRHPEERSGKNLAFDQEVYLVRDGRAALRTFAGDRYLTTGRKQASAAWVSARPTFVGEDTIFAPELHGHSVWKRKVASVLGLSLLGATWITSLARRPKERIAEAISRN